MLLKVRSSVFKGKVMGKEDDRERKGLKEGKEGRKRIRKKIESLTSGTKMETGLKK